MGYDVKLVVSIVEFNINLTFFLLTLFESNNKMLLNYLMFRINNNIIY